MWIVQVIEIGTGKLLDEAYSADRKKVDTAYKKFMAKYPDQSVMMEYFS